MSEAGAGGAGGGVPDGPPAGSGDEFGDFLDDVLRDLEAALETGGRGRGEAAHSRFLDPRFAALDWLGARGRLRGREG